MLVVSQIIRIFNYIIKLYSYIILFIIIIFFLIYKFIHICCLYLKSKTLYRNYLTSTLLSLKYLHAETAAPSWSHQNAPLPIKIKPYKIGIKYVTHNTCIISSTTGMYWIPEQCNSVLCFQKLVMLRTQQLSIEGHCVFTTVPFADSCTMQTHKIIKKSKIDHIEIQLQHKNVYVLIKIN